MEIEVESRVSTKKVDQLKTIERKKRVYNYLFITFFLLVVALQSYISFDEDISIRIEFGTQAMFYFLTIIMMAVATVNLLNTIKKIFGLENNSLKKEVS
jgi:UDP-N-acetylmuramyl pentapeptide phosphotransferase/UDP-N-acetylglucosamine-1-phosphate transferase